MPFEIFSLKRTEESVGGSKKRIPEVFPIIMWFAIIHFRLVNSEINIRFVAHETCHFAALFDTKIIDLIAM